jgi:putative copper resistance protein D
LKHEVSSNFWAWWAISPEITIPLALLCYFYFNIASSKGAPKRDQFYFYSGVLTVLLVVNTPIGTRAPSLFWCHMVQHMVLMMISGPLLVLGSVAHFKARGKVFLFMTNPWISWGIYASLMMGIHFTSLHATVMKNIWIHNFIEVPAYIIVAYLFYYNLLEKKTSASRISPALSVFSLFFMMVPETLTGFFIYVAPKSLYDDMYELTDQRIGGSLMWAGSMIIDAGWLAFAVYHWLKSEEQKSLEVDAEIVAEELAKRKK